MRAAILVRFDDICPTMDWSEWKRAVDVMEKFDVKPLIGVIPKCQDADLMINSPRKDFWEYIKELQDNGYAVAMHGYLHKFDTNHHGIVNVTPHSEFAGHSYQEQYEKIKQGKKILLRHGIQTDIFFAPAHSYDENTLKALAANGFKYLSDGKSLKPFYREGIMCIPCRASGCPKIGISGYYTAVFHAHEWARPDKAHGSDQLVHLCKEHQKKIVTFKEFAEQKQGKYITQLLDEKAFLFLEYCIKPSLRPIVRWIKGLKRR